MHISILLYLKGCKYIHFFLIFKVFEKFNCFIALYIKRINYNKNQSDIINLGSIQNGMYFLIVESDGGKYTKKIIVQR
jgi:hypothetical protein